MKLLILIGLLFAPGSVYADDWPTPTRDLVGEVFNQEYFTIVNAQKEGKPLWDFYLSQEGLRLLVRASFVRAPAPFHPRLLRRQRQHLRELKKLVGRNKMAETFLTLQHKPFSKQHAELIASTFTTEASRSSWLALTSAVAATNSSCSPLPAAHAKQWQSLARAATTNQRQPFLQALHTLPAKDAVCQAQRLAKQVAKKDEPSPSTPAFVLFKTAQQVSHPTGTDPAVQASYTNLLLQRGLYPEALRQLVGLQKRYAAFRLLYNSTQRVFSYRQRGDGAVALRQSL